MSASSREGARGQTAGQKDRQKEEGTGKATAEESKTESPGITTARHGPPLVLQRPACFPPSFPSCMLCARTKGGWGKRRGEKGRKWTRTIAGKRQLVSTTESHTWLSRFQKVGQDFDRYPPQPKEVIRTSIFSSRQLLAVSL